MPLPLIPIILLGAGGASAITGIIKSIKAAVDTGEAKNTNVKANTVLDNAKKAVDFAGKASGQGLEALGAKKVFVINKSINRFVESFEKIKNIEMQDSSGLQELNKFVQDKQTFSEFKQMGGYVSSLLGGSIAGGLGGALTAFGAYSAAATFAAASTGTAIATLSGVAATNATLAFFGGGAIAAGGLGMAVGTAVLGGIVVGPALAILGFIVGANAEKNLENAKTNLAEARKIEAELSLAIDACNNIRRRAFLFIRLLLRLDAIFAPLIFQMENIIKDNGEDFSKYKEKDQETIAAAVSTAVAIKSVLDTPILTEDGKLTEISSDIAKTIFKEQFGKEVSIG